MWPFHRPAQWHGSFMGFPMLSINFIAACCARAERVRHSAKRTCILPDDLDFSNHSNAALSLSMKAWSPSCARCDSSALCRYKTSTCIKEATRMKRPSAPGASHLLHQGNFTASPRRYKQTHVQLSSSSRHCGKKAVLSPPSPGALQAGSC